MSTEPGVIRADHNPGFYTRFLIMGVGALAVAGWFLYDGMYAWPLQHEKYVAYQQLVEEFRGDEWEAYAEERGWSVDPPEKDRTEAEIAWQYYSAAIAAAIGVALLAKVLLARGQWIESDGSQITTSWGQTVPFESVTEINKKKWSNKGLAYVTYNEGGGAKRFTVDDFKFHRAETDAILYQIEQVAGVDKIVGGDPEPAPGSRPGDENEPPAEPATA